LNVEEEKISKVNEILSVIPELYSVLLPMFVFLTFYEGDNEDASTVCLY
jgi:hypothetical protein